MKSLIKLTGIAVLALSFGLSVADAKPRKQKMKLQQEFDTLGDNQALVERAKELNAEKRVQIVQNRLVDRYNRIEVGVSGALLGGGDSYIQTSSLGGLLDYHISPKFSLGVRYQHYYNTLTNEGKSVYDRAQQQSNQNPYGAQRAPEIDFPKDSALLAVSFYPIYGKLNFFDAGVAQFDLYLLAGYGRMMLNSGTSDLISAGIGTGLWVNQHFSARLEGRWMTYQDLLGSENRRQNSMQGMLSLGFLL